MGCLTFMVDFFDLVPGGSEGGLSSHPRGSERGRSPHPGRREGGLSLLDGEMKHFRKEIGISLQMHHLMAKNTRQIGSPDSPHLVPSKNLM